MAVIKRKGSKSYYVRFTAPDGTRVFETARTTDKRQAEEYEAHLKARYWREHQLGQSQGTWPEAVLSWLKSTKHRDRRNVEQRLRWLDGILGALSLRQINQSVLHRVRTEKLADGASPATVNRYLAVVSAVLRHAQKAGMVDSVPPIPRMKEPEGRVRYLTYDEADRLIKHLRGNNRRGHLLDMVEFGLATGLREANICGMRWDRIDLSRRLAWVPASESKTRRALRVPLNDLALTVLERRGGVNPDWVFTYQGKPVTRCNNSSFRKAVRACELHDVTFHSIRHTWASWHVMAGTPLQVVMELGGWTNMRTVLRYAHLAPDHLASFAGNAVQNWRTSAEDAPEALYKGALEGRAAD